jgi:hypothetical protein
MSIPRPRPGLLVAAFLALAALLPRASMAAELVMFSRDGCPWCARFEREIGPIYPRTAEGAVAPLRRVAVAPGGAHMPGLREPVVAAPTFVLFDEGRERGRITGYPGDDAFWGLLGRMLAGMGDAAPPEGGASAMVKSQ